jgi:hypothetical protein
MKATKIFLSLALFIGAFSFATAQEGVEGPIMTFETLTVDYGTIEQNGDPLRVAEFTNTGTEPLVISNARGSCGCTVPVWPKEPIMPGESSQIEIRYDTKRLGKINKTVTLTTNQAGEPIVLRVKGQINKAVEQESVPENKTGLKIPK